MSLPGQLSPEDFNTYPPEAKRFAVSRLPLLRRLPLSLVPLLLRELIGFDWKFPAERLELTRQFDYLAGLSAPDLTRTIAPFARLRLSPELERSDWVAAPASFSERLTTHLWATHQIDAFRDAATAYMNAANAALPDPPLPTHRLAIVILGQGHEKTDYPLFHNLSKHGTLFTQIDPKNSREILLNVLTKRANSYPAPYSHWHIEGGPGTPAPSDIIAHISYAALSPVRAALQSRMQKTYTAGAFDPEAFRTMLARTRPEEIGLDPTHDPVLSRFQLSVLTEGSGTQVFSTTFVQWAAREALRRAQPLTLLAQFAPRQREKPMNELLAEAQRMPELDPEGSLIDADQGAYYTWINQRRLPGAANAAFLALFGTSALVIAPSFEPSKIQTDPLPLTHLITRLA